MPAVTRVGDNNTGHDDCPPTALASGSPDVFTNGISTGRVGDPYNPHGCPAHVPHVGNIASGAPHVFINGHSCGRVGDPVTCGGSVAVGSSNVYVGNLGGTAGKDEIRAAIAKATLWNRAQDTDDNPDKTILSLPEISKNMANQASTEIDFQGWMYLSQMFERWLVNKARNGEKEGYSKEVFIVSWDWLYQFQRVKDAVNYLKVYALNYNGKQALANRLKDIFKDEENTSGAFSYSESFLKWDDEYINYVSIPGFFLPDFMEVSGATAAMGAFTIRVLPKGTIETISNTTKRIHVTEIAVYADDRFQFEGWYPLFWWSYKDKQFSKLDLFNDNFRYLSNGSFQEFRKTYNIGEDFKIYSDRYMVVDDFEPLSFDIDTNWNPIEHE